MDWFKRMLGGKPRPAPNPWPPMTDAEITETLRRQIEGDVAGGFVSEDEIVENAVAGLEGEADARVLRPRAEAMLREALAAHAAAQGTWPERTDCDRLDAAFAALEAEGVIARQNFTCCGTCGSAEIWDEIDAARAGGRPTTGYAFFHMQDTERATEGGGLYLNYGSVEEGDEPAVAVGRRIVARLEEHGLATDWDGRIEQRIGVGLEWRKRR